MNLLASPLLRIALHLLLALAVLLQAGTALAMRGMVAMPDAAAETAADTAVRPIGAHTMKADAAASVESRLPPCHVAMLAKTDTTAGAAATTDTETGAGRPACCDDSALGQLCQWACAQAVSLTSVALIVPARAVHGERLAAPLPPRVAWPPSSLLRPPIA